MSQYGLHTPTHWHEYAGRHIYRIYCLSCCLQESRTCNWARLAGSLSQLDVFIGLRGSHYALSVLWSLIFPGLHLLGLKIEPFILRMLYLNKMSIHICPLVMDLKGLFTKKKKFLSLFTLMSLQTSKIFFCETQKERSHHSFPNIESKWELWALEKHHESCQFNFCAMLQIFQRHMIVFVLV